MKTSFLISVICLHSTLFLLVGCGGENASIKEGAAASLLEHDTIPQTVSAAAPGSSEEPISFNQQIRPILSDNCFACHGFDEETREADLRLDTFDGATHDSAGYAAVVPGDREESELWIRITDKSDPMPPKKSHKALTADEIELLGRWIDQGAVYDEHWAYSPPERPALPVVSDPSWAEHPIDRFILAKLETHKLRPSPRADKRTLMRRVTFDLTGLPPTPEQVALFMGDDSPGVYERYVDSLMASESFGEHLAVWWLDLVRYGDSKGYHGDQSRPAWAYRDWVVQAFNSDMPFDQFSKMQLGGDLMQGNPLHEMRVASAYNRLALQTNEGGAQPKEYVAIYNADRVTNFSEVWLGSSVGCAQCHDHKFDPFTIEDFYALAAFFSDINQTIIGTESPYATHSPPYMFVPQNDEQRALVAEHDKRYRQFVKDHPGAMLVEEHLTSDNPRPPLPGPGGSMPEYGDELKKLIEERHRLAKQVPILIETRALETPRIVRVLPRGDWQDESGEVMLPGTPAFLDGPVSSTERRLNRLDLARWLFDPSNPLTARVVVNRLWGRYLGSPLSVNTVDLGSQGRAPTHAELMDWLAIEFRDSGWQIKHMIRKIVTSETYKQLSDVRGDLAVIDPNNKRFFARQSAVRLPAEAIRDFALQVSGLLDSRVGGPSVFPYQPDGHWDALNFPRRRYPTSTGKDLYRRSLYTWVQRTFPHPMATTFDAPSREACIGQRHVSSTPLQAMAMLNGPIFVESARVLAEQLVRDEEADGQRLERLYLLALAREPRPNEKQMLVSLLNRQRDHFTASPEDASSLAATGQAPTVEGLDIVEVAAWTSVCRVVMNLYESTTRN